MGLIRLSSSLDVLRGPGSRFSSQVPKKKKISLQVRVRLSERELRDPPREKKKKKKKKKEKKSETFEMW